MLSYLFTYNKPFGKIIRPLRAYLEAGLRPDMSPKVLATIIRWLPLVAIDVIASA